MSKQDGRDRMVTPDAVDDGLASILHIDLDAFFASVELLERPELRGLPVIVGGRGPRSVVTAATYEARKYGVNSAMPMALALRRCPNAVVLEPHFDRYQHFSRLVMEIFSSVTPRVEQLGIDEAFLDVAGARRLLGSPWHIAHLVRARVLASTGLTCSVGVATTKFVAKLASGRAKPDGVLVIGHDETLGFLHPLPVSALWGVGATTEEQLRRLGLSTVGDVAAVPLERLQKSLGRALGLKLHELSWARDPRRVVDRPEEKSVGHEMTFSHDVVDEVHLHRELLRMSDQVAVRLRRAGLVGRTVVLKLRYSDFTTITRSRTLAEPTDLARRIYEEVRDIHSGLGQGGTRIRLIGVRMEQLSPASSTPAALWDDDESWREAEQAIDQVSERFGVGTVAPATLLGGRRRRTPPTPAPGKVEPQ